MTSLGLLYSEKQAEQPLLFVFRLASTASFLGAFLTADSSSSCLISKKVPRSNLKDGKLLRSFLLFCLSSDTLCDCSWCLVPGVWWLLSGAWCQIWVVCCHQSETQAVQGDTGQWQQHLCHTAHREIGKFLKRNKTVYYLSFVAGHLSPWIECLYLFKGIFAWLGEHLFYKKNNYCGIGVWGIEGSLDLGITGRGLGWKGMSDWGICK